MSELDDMELAKLRSVAFIERAMEAAESITDDDVAQAMKAHPSDTVMNIVINTLLTSEGFDIERISKGIDEMPEGVVIRSPLTGALVFHFVRLFVEEMTVDQITEALAFFALVKLMNEERVFIPKDILSYCERNSDG